MHITSSSGMTRKCLATRLREAGAVSFNDDAAGGLLRYRVGAEVLTPGQAAERLLPVCDLPGCGKYPPFCRH